MNPELQRNLWLEASQARLAWTGAVLALFFGAALVIAGGSPSDLHRVLTYAGAAVFGVAALVWGPRAAGRTVAAEVLQKTWDFQRLSALTPWQMTFGKLAGATSLSWLAAITGLIALNFALIGRGQGPSGSQWTLIGVAAAVLLQAGAMAMALIGVRRARADGRPPSLRIGWGGGFGALVMLGIMGKTLPNPGLGRGDLLPGLVGERAWWGIAAPGGWFVGLSLAAFAAWAVIAAWRLMRLELQMQNRPWAWPGFLVFTAIYFAGFFGGEGGALRWAAAGVVFATGAYVAAFAEPADRVRLRQWVEAVRRRNLERMILTVPAAFSALKLSALAAIGLMLSAPVREVEQPAGLAFAALAFLIRDIGVIAYFRFGPRTRRGDFGAVLGLALLYYVGGVLGGTLGGQAGLALFAPSPGDPWLSAISGGVMAVLVWVAAWMRIRAPETTDS